jgi:hypothetical protein
MTTNRLPCAKFRKNAAARNEHQRRGRQQDDWFGLDAGWMMDKDPTGPIGPVGSLHFATFVIVASFATVSSWRLLFR